MVWFAIWNAILYFCSKSAKKRIWSYSVSNCNSIQFDGQSIISSSSVGCNKTEKYRVQADSMIRRCNAAQSFIATEILKKKSGTTPWHHQPLVPWIQSTSNSCLHHYIVTASPSSDRYSHSLAHTHTLTPTCKQKSEHFIAKIKRMRKKIVYGTAASDSHFY